jgi:hypothetical protein
VPAQPPIRVDLLRLASQVRQTRLPIGSIRGGAEALYQPIPRQRNANRVGNVETNRTQLNHDATVDEHNPSDTMRLRVVEPNNITSP